MLQLNVEFSKTDNGKVITRKGWITTDNPSDLTWHIENERFDNLLDEYGDDVEWNKPLPDRCGGWCPERIEVLEQKTPTGKIMINTDCNAPCCPCEIVDVDTGKTRLVQSDWDYPGFATTFGFDLRSVQKCPRCARTLKVADPDGYILDEEHECEMDEEEIPVLGQTGLELVKCCNHQHTDGTVTCPQCGVDAGDFMSAAYDFLKDNDGLQVEDPGYFLEN